MVKDRTVLVTGGAGFIGSHLVTGLLAAGAGRVRVLDNFDTGTRENLAHLEGERRLAIHADSVLDARAVAHACRGADAVFHLACLGVRHSLHSPQENLRVNSEGTLRVLEASRRAGVGRFVHVSSSEVYGTARSVPMGEDHPTLPATVYGAGKLAGEALARAYHETYGFPSVVVRPFNNYGPRSHFEGDSGEVIPRFALAALAGRPPVIFGDGTQTRDFIYVEDTVRALLVIAGDDRCLGRTLNVGQGSEVSVNQLAAWVLQLTGRTDLRPVHAAPRPGDVYRLCADTAAVQALTGFVPQVSFPVGLSRVVDWFREQAKTDAGLLFQQPVRNWEAA
jgi:UDP-glucose 4-epimerase